jgi:hypothetical protein
VGQRYQNPFKGKPHIAFKRETTRYDGTAPNSIGFSINETWGALKRCWRGYKIAMYKEYDTDRATLYAKRIRKLQLELGIPILEFPALGLYGIDPADVDLMCD